MEWNSHWAHGREREPPFPLSPPYLSPHSPSPGPLHPTLVKRSSTYPSPSSTLHHRPLRSSSQVIPHPQSSSHDHPTQSVLEPSAAVLWSGPYVEGCEGRDQREIRGRARFFYSVFLRRLVCGWQR
ncbi:hypothetical protein, variant 2 [Cryptococcus amylolentus CBS 6039]|uniref:Uncharacterized protein n=1 Tax=Cryptococcus amylolentus CBS 6039 TaxID=1295533 RepID=A0A1E3HQ45_9TREE|nr:hypothetical protein L202_04078 [Cryptococcus amylolentus CBS 6039]XP_018993487.1 hypothetical protein, variant 1 [Cryptococcus amylolentus CBS 6039]XP_018993488.1 hypothetical protein, variant 2 [Cryptococcus amylolentus CBS 6039]ODN78440.1 hypothetical protein L202_04078 [Cryptococcus amylolentus CBS 6039]ODN78441.1 hypothetical protein, variant 1 [Cryptococcus amylolentus CBS 6039]ODN78442.1 hypothetical protein, variant 2 [Cryptococcus amylolentus CBS 6039]